MTASGIRVTLGKLAVTKAMEAGKPRGTIIILHGSCDTGAGMKEWLRDIMQAEFAFPEYRVLYPSAPTQPYTLMNGQVLLALAKSVGIWFDRLCIGMEMPENKMTIEPTASALSRMLHQESELSGIPLSKTVIGGFSMGGTMALHLGYRLHPEVAGVFALSSFLHPESQVYRHLGENDPSSSPVNTSSSPSAGFDSMTPSTNSSTPVIDQIYRNINSVKETRALTHTTLPRLFMSQGSKDPLVHYPWAKDTFLKLRNYGAEGHFHTLPHMKHDIEKSQLSLLHRWINSTLASSSIPQKGSKNQSRGKSHHVNDDFSIPAYDW